MDLIVEGLVLGRNPSHPQMTCHLYVAWAIEASPISQLKTRHVYLLVSTVLVIVIGAGVPKHISGKQCSPQSRPILVYQVLSLHSLLKLLQIQPHDLHVPSVDKIAKTLLRTFELPPREIVEKTVTPPHHPPHNPIPTNPIIPQVISVRWTHSI